MKKGDIIQQVRLNGEPYTFPDPVQATVVWVIDGEVSAMDNNDAKAYHVFSLENSDWDVVVDAAPTFQSQVASLTDEQLKAAVESMRSGRVHLTPLPKEKKARAPKSTPEEDNLSKLLASLSPEKQLALKAKLGLA